ncbi:hypothetical protein Pla175_15430 [Pirellulimonas nuda]|uniref:Uncharacterized protein n=1 Tax=Pirellulimonas nuda TaxID=2528009 RepID=A0A518D9K6_9BACT|nr:hypothetical protein [Pirellulimonas nuda]QDU88172.1 hypothetical protein Pla175_15430 [Pirellulimonas nuda]
MSDTNPPELAWRETYFVLFRSSDRPTIMQLESAIADASPRLKLKNLEANEEGYFQSLLVQAPEDNAAMEISYEAGDVVIEQSTELAKSMRKRLTDDQLAQLLRADARLDVMHFEQVQDEWDDQPADEEFFDDTFDPASLISVVEALASLTGGVAIDPGAGEVLE